MVVLLKQEPVS